MSLPMIDFAVVQSISRVTLCDPMDYSTPGLSLLHYLPELLKFMSTELVMLSNHLILRHPLLHLFSIFPSIRVFFSVSALRIRQPKYWSFSFSISPSNEYSGLISFRTDWFDLPIQMTLKSLLQYHDLKNQFFSAQASLMVQLSHSYMTTGKTIALSIWTFVCKVMSLLFNMLPRFVITFHPRSKYF